MFNVGLDQHTIDVCSLTLPSKEDGTVSQILVTKAREEQFHHGTTTYYIVELSHITQLENLEPNLIPDFALLL